MSTPSTPDFTFIEPRFAHALGIWWAWYWRTNLWTFVVIVMVAILLEVMGVPQRVAVILSSFVSLATFIAVGILVTRTILRKSFRKFRIGLLAEAEPLPASDITLLNPNLRHALRIWWAWMWRSILLGALAVMLLFPTYMFASLFGYNISQIASSIIGVAAAVFAFILVLLTKILDENFGNFRVCLVSRPNEPTGQPLINDMEPSKTV
ncbi:MAG: hypothetical protein HY313_10145 [Acidobacteria bacterium]|nr:hypothetical protein [Acidobacteriota bacterium]